eukprot:scaffold22431_cov53-Phaeocystis_antarctica.AAC.2
MYTAPHNLTSTSKWVRIPGTLPCGKTPRAPSSHHTHRRPRQKTQSWRLERFRHECERALAVRLALEPAALVHRAAAVLTPGEGEGWGVREGEGEGRGWGGGEGKGGRAKGRARARLAMAPQCPRSLV